MRATTKSGQFSHISVADTHGDGISDTGVRSNIAGYDFFEASLSGRNTISSGPDLPLYSNNQLTFSVPVYQNKTIIGVLRGVIAIDQMNNIGVSVPSNGSYYLIKRDGSIVFNSQSANLQNADQTIFSVLGGTNHANTNEIDLMRKNIGLSVSGMCVKACPKHLISFVTANQQAVVRCSNCDKGALTNKVCKIGCIGCMKCEKTCQYDAVHVVNSLASVDPSKCIGCGECVDVCPRHCITMFNPEI